MSLPGTGRARSGVRNTPTRSPPLCPAVRQLIFNWCSGSANSTALDIFWILSSKAVRSWAAFQAVGPVLVCAGAQVDHHRA